MDLIVFFFVVAVEIGILIRFAPRFGFAPFPTFALIYILMAQVSLLMVYSETWDYKFLNYYTRGGYIEYFIPVILIYFGISLGIAFLFGGRSQAAKTTKLSVPRLDLKRIERMMPTINAAFGISIFVYLCIMAAILDWSIVWANSVYLLMTQPKMVVKVTQIGALLSLMPFVAILAAVLSAINISFRNKLSAAAFGIVALMLTTYYIGSHQRLAMLPAVAFFVVLSVVSDRGNYVLRGAAVAIALFAQASGLAGRGSGSHGISTVPDSIVAVFNADLGSRLSDLMLNLSEGIFVLAEGFTRSPDYPLVYKLLSFSPLPSAIDGFTRINSLYQARISFYVPLSSFTEAYFFGPAFLALLVLLFWGSLVLYKRVVARNQYIGLAVGFMLLLSLIQSFAYPIRNSLKPLYIADIIAISFLVYSRRKQPAKPAIIDAQLRDALMRPRQPARTDPRLMMMERGRLRGH